MAKKKKKDQDQGKKSKNRGKGEQPPVTPETTPDTVATGLEFAFEHGQLTLSQVLQGIEEGGPAAEVVLEMIGTLVSRHNRSVQEQLRPTKPPSEDTNPERVDAEPPRMGPNVDLNAIRDQMSRAEPRGDDGIVVTTVRVPSGLALADLKANALKEVAQLIATL